MTRPNIKLRDLSAKIEEAKQEETSSTIINEEPVRELAKSKKAEASVTVKEKMEAMSKYNLKPATIGIKADLELDDDFNLTVIAKKFGKDKQKLAAEYILKGIEKDIEKIGIFEHKK
ncbi:MAG: hypothetical protein EBS06_05295 [Proteobacteria bacterium]|nr:hypothetical protein [Pseudomonadota bacterium]